LGAERLFGWSETEMFGQKLDRLSTPEDQERGLLANEMHDALIYGRGGGDEGWRVRKNGSRAAGERSPIRDGEGAVIGFTKVVRDRTAQRTAEQNAADERRALEILNRAGSALGAVRRVNSVWCFILSAPSR
jgi:PAS domain S-box-containing protein